MVQSPTLDRAAYAPAARRRPATGNGQRATSSTGPVLTGAMRHGCDSLGGRACRWWCGNDVVAATMSSGARGCGNDVVGRGPEVGSDGDGEAGGAGVPGVGLW